MRRGVVLCPDLPRTPGMARAATQSLSVLAERIAADAQWIALATQPRGLGDSKGDFSVRGWMEDVSAAVTDLREADAVEQMFICGLGLGGVIGVAVAAADPLVGGVATLAAPSDLSAWAGDPRRFLDSARAAGVVRDRDFPPDLDAWCREFRDVRPLDLALELDPRPVLVIHGIDDEVVPPIDARALADSAGTGAELRLIAGAGHNLRNDPRAVAVLLGWLSRQG